MMSSPSPPLIVSLHGAGLEAAGVDDVVAAEPVEDQPVVGRFGEEDVHRGLQAEHGDACQRRRATPNTSSPLVALTVTVSACAVAAAVRAAARSRSICVTSVPLRSPTTMLSAPPSARKSMRLDVVEVHRDVGDVADEQHAPAVGQDVDVLADVRAEEQHRVGAVLAFDRVVAVARIPLEHVVAGAQQRHVVAVVAEHEVVAVAAEQRVRALAAEDRVVAGAAVDGQLDDAGRQRRGRDRVVAAEPVDDERVVRAFARRRRSPAPAGR